MDLESVNTDGFQATQAEAYSDMRHRADVHCLVAGTVSKASALRHRDESLQSFYGNLSEHSKALESYAELREKFGAAQLLLLELTDHACEESRKLASLTTSALALSRLALHAARSCENPDAMAAATQAVAAATSAAEFALDILGQKVEFKNALPRKA